MTRHGVNGGESPADALLLGLGWGTPIRSTHQYISSTGSAECTFIKLREGLYSQTAFDRGFEPLQLYPSIDV